MYLYSYIFLTPQLNITYISGLKEKPSNFFDEAYSSRTKLAKFENR